MRPFRAAHGNSYVVLVASVRHWSIRHRPTRRYRFESVGSAMTGALPRLKSVPAHLRFCWCFLGFAPDCEQIGVRPCENTSENFRTKSDTQTTFNCANPAKCRFSISTVSALIAASFRQNHAVLRNSEMGSTRVRAGNPVVQHCEGRSQELNGDLT